MGDPRVVAEVPEPYRSRLPLQDLADDIARLAGKLVVGFEALPSDIGGLCWRDDRGVAIIVDVVTDALEKLGETVESTWAHELAHAIDPTFHASAREVREAFAVTMTPLLLGAEPATVADALALLPKAS